MCTLLFRKFRWSKLENNSTKIQKNEAIFNIALGESVTHRMCRCKNLLSFTNKCSSFLEKSSLYARMCYQLHKACCKASAKLEMIQCVVVLHAAKRINRIVFAYSKIYALCFIQLNADCSVVTSSVFEKQQGLNSVQ